MPSCCLSFSPTCPHFTWGNSRAYVDEQLTPCLHQSLTFSTPVTMTQTPLRSHLRTCHHSKEIIFHLLTIMSGPSNLFTYSSTESQPLTWIPSSSLSLTFLTVFPPFGPYWKPRANGQNQSLNGPLHALDPILLLYSPSGLEAFSSLVLFWVT